MSTRHYILFVLITLGISLVFGFLNEKKKPKELAIIFLWTSLGATVIVGIVYGLSKALTTLGIAEGGFTV
jgi:hypothetical protein|tara:strand:+ start:201 stop:410 length:210 start_codon:yes stop_codon:yes gene_type:complete